MQNNYSKKDYEQGLKPGPAKNSFSFAHGILVLSVVMLLAELVISAVSLIKHQQISPNGWSILVISVIGIIYSTSVLQNQKEAEDKAKDEAAEEKNSGEEE